MKVEERAFQCGCCGHEFIGELVLDCPVDVAVAAMKALRCPKCGKRQVMFLLGKRYWTVWNRLRPTSAAGENQGNL